MWVLFSMGMGRTMGIDWGERRIGVAVSDPMGWTSQGIAVIPGGDLEEIARLAAAQEVTRVVVGLPVHDDGSPSKSAPKILAFVDVLKERLAPVPVETWDESNTSYEANRILKERGMGWKESKAHVDRVAAAVMLQSWLDEHPSKLPGVPEEEQDPT